MSVLREAMLDGLWVNPLDGRERILSDKKGNPIAGVILWDLDAHSWGPSHLHLEEIRSLKKGGARKLMEILVERADSLGATLSGVAKPLYSPVYKSKMPIGKLKRWYKEFGFDVEGDEIRREPKGASLGASEHSQDEMIEKVRIQVDDIMDFEYGLKRGASGFLVCWRGITKARRTNLLRPKEERPEQTHPWECAPISAATQEQALGTLKHVVLVFLEQMRLPATAILAASMATMEAAWDVPAKDVELLELDWRERLEEDQA